MIVICANDYPFMYCKEGTTYEQATDLAKLFCEHDKINLDSWEAYERNKVVKTNTFRPPGIVFYHVHDLREV